jgi:hypothetical protein
MVPVRAGATWPAEVSGLGTVAVTFRAVEPTTGRDARSTTEADRGTAATAARRAPTVAFGSGQAARAVPDGAPSIPGGGG